MSLVDTTLLRTQKLWFGHMAEVYRGHDQGVVDTCVSAVALLDHIIGAQASIDTALSNIKGWTQAVSEDMAIIQRRPDYRAMADQALTELKMAAGVTAKEAVQAAAKKTVPVAVKGRR